MAGKQIRFPDKQTHDKRFELAMLVFSIACIVFTVIAINVVAGGDFG